MGDHDDDNGAGPARKRGLFGRQRVPIRYLIPNLATLLALCAGVTAIRAAVEARYDLAVALIVLAALLDGIDGRLARALKGQSRFGAELDSLADFVSFGVAPAILIYMWGLQPLKGFGWIAVLVFACAASLRLARFNAALDEDRPKWQSNFFTGVPAPAGAVVVMLPIYLSETGLLPIRDWPPAVAVYVLAIAGLLVSTLPTYSGKLLGERIAREYVAAALATAALAVALLVTYPFPTLTVATLGYLVAIPWSVRRFQALRREWEASQLANPPAAPHPEADPRPKPPPSSEMRH